MRSNAQQLICEQCVGETCALLRLTVGSICVFIYVSMLLQVEIEGLTGDIRFNEDGRRTNYTLQVVEMSSSSDMIKVGEWSDQFHFRPITQRPDRVAHRNDFERNRTWIVTTIIEEPYIMPRKNIDPNKQIEEKDKYEGYCKDLADILSKRLGIKCKLKITHRSPWTPYTHTTHTCISLFFISIFILYYILRL